MTGLADDLERNADEALRLSDELDAKDACRWGKYGATFWVVNMRAAAVAVRERDAAVSERDQLRRAVHKYRQIPADDTERLARIREWADNLDQQADEGTSEAPDGVLRECAADLRDIAEWGERWHGIAWEMISGSADYRLLFGDAGWKAAGSSIREAREMRAERDALRDEVDEYAELTQRQAEILRGVAEAVNGPPSELTMWSHHDLAEKTAALKAQCDALLWALTVSERDVGLWCEEIDHIPDCECDDPDDPESLNEVCKANSTWRLALIEVDANHGDRLVTWLPEPDALRTFGEMMDRARSRWGDPFAAALEAVPVPERPERCPRCGSDDRGDRYGNEDGTRCPDSFHTPPSAPEEPNDD